MPPPVAVASYLQAHGWPDARPTSAGVTGTGQILWAVASRPARPDEDELVRDWIAEADRAAAAAGAALGVLVLPRDGYPSARAASWWALLDIGQLARLTNTGLPLSLPEVASAPVRMHLSTAVVLLRSAGHGEPLAQGAAAEVSA